MRGRPRRKVVQDDSDEPDSGAETDASDSDFVVNGRASNKRRTNVCTRGRRGGKRQRIRDDSDDDSVHQAGTSGMNGINDSGSSDSEAPTVAQFRSKRKTRSKNVVTNGTTLNGGQTSSPRRRGRPPKKAKRSSPAEDSDDNTSPQPSTSGINSQQQNGVQHDSDPEEHSDSGSESQDSDYMMPADDTRKVTKKKRGKPVRTSTRAKKQRVLTNSFAGGAKSQKDNVSLDPVHIEALAHRCVYFLLIEDQKKYAIKRKTIVTNVFKDEAYSPRLYSSVILKANTILMKIFGMELMELENQKDSYLLVNILKRELSIEEFIELPRLKHQQQGLVLYLLTVIFMNNNVITEDELIKALKGLNIDYTSKKPHAVFGDVKKFITTELVKQMYLNYECINKDPPQYEITWGLRAKEEVDKRDLLQFACRVMDDTTPESWILQYKDAEESASPE